MNKQEKLNKLARTVVEIQFAALTADQIEHYLKQALYDDISKHGDADEELVSQGIALFFEGDEEAEVQFYIDNGYAEHEITNLMGVEKPKHPLYWKA